MPDISVTWDGFERRQQTEPAPGRWYSNSQDSIGPDNGVSGFYRSIVVGFANVPNHSFLANIALGPLPIPVGGRVSQFDIVITPQEMFKAVDFVIKGVIDSTVAINYSTLSSQQALTVAGVSFQSSDIDGFNADASWVPDSASITFDVKDIVNQILRDSSYSEGAEISLIMIPIYQGTTGYMRWASLEHAGGTSTTASYTAALEPIISSVGIDNIIQISEKDVSISGSNLGSATKIRIYDVAGIYDQSITSASNDKVLFDVEGSIPVKNGYTLELTVNFKRILFTIDVQAASSGGGGPSGGGTSTGFLATQDDGHEYADTFPGLWETTASAASQTVNSFQGCVIVGRWYIVPAFYKCSIQTQAIALDSGQSFDFFRILLPIFNCYKQTNLIIKAIADPDITIGSSNIITGKSLTSAQVLINNNSWVNFNAFSFWTPGQNPKSIEVGDIVMEVMSHANWSTGKRITFILDSEDLGGGGGLVAINSQESSRDSTTFEYSSAITPGISSVGGDNVVALGESAIVIVGVNLDAGIGASNLSIEKGVIVAPQQITSSNSTTIVFDLIGANLVSGTGYTIKVDVDGTEYTRLIEIEDSSGGSITGNISLNEDGHEYGASFPGTWESESSSSSDPDGFLSDLVIFGRWYFRDNNYKASFRTEPVALSQGQALDEFMISIPVTNAYKRVQLKVKAVLDPDVIVGSGNIISSQTLTNAEITIDNNTWGGFSEFGNWTPNQNPILLDFTPLAQEVIDGSGWSSGKRITFIIDAERIGGAEGYVGVTAQELGTNEVEFSFKTNTPPSIASVDVDNVLSIGQAAVLITGTALGNASNLTISKGAIVEPQVIISNNDVSILFDVVGNTITPDTDYIISFDIGGVNYSSLIEIIPTPTDVIISSFAGNNAVRHDSFDQEIIGEGFDGIDSVTVIQGDIVTGYALKEATNTRVVIDFFRGKMKYGPATLRVLKDSIFYSHDITIFPRIGYIYADVLFVSTGNNSLLFNADPSFNVGDQVSVQQFTNQGYPLSISDDGVVVLFNGTLSGDNNTFLAESYDSNENIWYDLELITYRGRGFTGSNFLGGSGFLSKGIALGNDSVLDGADPVTEVEPPVITPGISSEKWEKVTQVDDSEIWEDC